MISVSIIADRRRAVAEPTPADAPRAEVTDPVFDFDAVEFGQLVAWRFAVRNAGTKPLRVQVDRTSCRCVAALFSRDPIQAGATGYVDVSFEIDTPGEVRSLVFLKTNDPLAPEITLAMHGWAVFGLGWEPKRVAFHASLGERVTRSVRLTAPPGSEVRRVGAEGAEGLAVQCEKTRDDRAGVVCDLRLTYCALRPGTGEAKVVVQFAGGVAVDVPVTCTVHGDLCLRPPRAFFGFVPKGTPSRRELTITSASQKAFTVMRVESADPKVNVRAERTRRAWEWRVVVQLATSEHGRIDAFARIITNAQGEETLSIPVTAHVD